MSEASDRRAEIDALLRGVGVDDDTGSALISYFMNAMHDAWEAGAEAEDAVWEAVLQPGVRQNPYPYASPDGLPAEQTSVQASSTCGRMGA